MGQSVAVDSPPKTTTDNRYLDSASIKELIVYGYCRNVESLLTNKLIPDIIHEIFLRYLDINIFNNQLIYIVKHEQKDNQYDGLHIMNHHNQRAFKCKIYDMNKIKAFQLTKAININQNVICPATNIELPPIMDQKLCKLYNEYYQFSSKTFKYDKKSSNIYTLLYILQKRNLSNPEHEIMIINNYELRNLDQQKQIIGFKWSILGSLPLNQHFISNAIYCNKYGLIAFHPKTLFKPFRPFIKTYPFNATNFYHCKSDRELILNVNRDNFGVVMFDHKILVIGGEEINTNIASWQSLYYKCLNCVELIDLNEKTVTNFTSCKYNRNQPGAIYEKQQNKVYIGGGDYDRFNEQYKMIESCDLNKGNVWFSDLPPTNQQHGEYPVLWTDVDNHNILYIASDGSNCVEYIDIRSGNNRWSQFQLDKYILGQPISTQHIIDAGFHSKLISIYQSLPI